MSFNFNPCCGLNVEVQKALKITASLQLAKGVFSLLLTSILILKHPRFGISGSAVMDHEIDPASNYFYEGVVPILLFSIYGIGFGLVLLVGASQRNHGKCRIWLIATVLETLIYLIVVVVIFIQLCNGESTFENIPGYLIQIGINAYMMVVVFAFLDELTSDPTAAGYNV